MPVELIELSEFQVAALTDEARRLCLDGQAVESVAERLDGLAATWGLRLADPTAKARRILLWRDAPDGTEP